MNISCVVLTLQKCFSLPLGDLMIAILNLNSALPSVIFREFTKALFFSFWVKNLL